VVAVAKDVPLPPFDPAVPAAPAAPAELDALASAWGLGGSLTRLLGTLGARR
jgi:hypothetical protein